MSVWSFKYIYHHRIISINFCFSQNSSGNDDGWNGFNTDNGKSSDFHTSSSSSSLNKNRTMKVTSKNVVEEDLLSLDVKSTANQRTAGGSKTAKKPEDDIWDILNN